MQKNAWGLTPEQELFAIEYFSSNNATQSYLKVKPNVTYGNAVHFGNEWANLPEVKTYLAFLRETVRNDKIMTAEEVLSGLSEVARGDDSNYSRHQKIYIKDKVKALEILAKHHMLLTDVSKQEIDQRVVIVNDLEGEDESEGQE